MAPNKAQKTDLPNASIIKKSAEILYENYISENRIWAETNSID
jgi:hypothetical protein